MTQRVLDKRNPPPGMAARRYYIQASAMGMFLLMVFMGLSNTITVNELDNESIKNTDARQDLGEGIDCTGYTFEDLFDYNYALFNIDIGDDWASAGMAATAYVNGSNSATVRENLDGLFDGFGGGNNGWISTDEREAVRSIGPQCIEDMDTRLGLREGIPHRSNSGVDWNDMEFVESGIALDEVDLVAPNHPQERSCQNIDSSQGCREIPTSATDDLQISLLVKDGENRNMQFNQLPNNGESNFTLALNVTNMTNAELVLTFPVLQGLRIVNYSMEDDGVELIAGVDYTAPVEEYLLDGKLRVYQNVDYDKSNWPTGRNLFIDFTTTEPQSNDIPQWQSPPSNNSIIPLMTGGEYLAVNYDTLDNWASDENGWNLDCTFAESQWSARQDELGNLLVTSPSGSTSSSATCGISDIFGANSEQTLDFTFGQPFTGSATITDGENIDFTINPTGLIAEMSVEAHAHQDSAMGANRSSIISNEAVTIALPMNGLKPGGVKIMGTVNANSMLNFEFMLDYELEKQSLPPVIEIKVTFEGKNATWNAGENGFMLKGEVSDPDGEYVELELVLCGAIATDFTRNGVNWEIDVPIATCMLQDISTYDVVITATDESNIESTLEINVYNPVDDGNSNQETNSDSDKNSEDSSGLPSASLFATLCVTLLGAAIFGRRREL